ncbi:MAG: 4Fe-4S binding protein, partial [Alphaproteobacteria bacterium]|nr:4Fe-4S binding protein [Alphaproteobacteria bacterium]
GHPARTLRRVGLSIRASLGILWSLRLGWRILANQGLPALRRGLALTPGLAGQMLLAAGWWPALFGI